MFFIMSSLFPSVTSDSISCMIQFNQALHSDTMISMLYGRQGAPWEFNLRDLLRWCECVDSFVKSRALLSESDKVAFKYV